MSGAADHAHGMARLAGETGDRQNRILRVTGDRFNDL